MIDELADILAVDLESALSRDMASFDEIPAVGEDQ